MVNTICYVYLKYVIRGNDIKFLSEMFLVTNFVTYKVVKFIKRVKSMYDADLY